MLQHAVPLEYVSWPIAAVSLKLAQWLHALDQQQSWRLSGPANRHQKWEAETFTHKPEGFSVDQPFCECIN